MLWLLVIGLVVFLASQRRPAPLELMVTIEPAPARSIGCGPALVLLLAVVLILALTR